MPTFTPPTVDDVSTVVPSGPMSKEQMEEARIGGWYRPTTRGVNVFKLNDGTYTQIQPPNNARVVAVYYGGHSTVITAAEAAALTAAGYAANIGA